MTSQTAAPAITQRRVEGVVPGGRLLGMVLLAVGVIVATGFIVPAFDRYMLLMVSAP